MGGNAEEEPLLLENFSRFLQDYSCTVQYNGDAFDQPFLEARYRYRGMASPFQRELPSVDLYRSLKPLKGLLKLSHMRQPDMENRLGSSTRKYCDGGQCIRLYSRYVKNRDSFLLEEILGHNEEDLLGLGRIWKMLSCLNLWEGHYQVSSADFTGESLRLSLLLPEEMPVSFSAQGEGFAIEGSGTQATLSVRTTNGKLRQYYSNYRDYDYIPSEDTAMPKILSACLDRKLRKKATRDTCYTWFSCSGSFLHSPEQQMEYLRHTLPYLLHTLR
ncbi:MAG: ribonuclease H-like domain-containing protein [Clostridiales bacterium]|nr:ribonuclease H-like domain-containing protein [Clostridiales bacterium]